MMTVENFKTKHENLFEIGACEHKKTHTHEFLTIDRFVDGNLICERKLIDRAQADARKMGFNHLSIGRYVRLN